MNAPVVLAPPAGSTIVGDLYADLQSRTLWLGVDAAVDPNGAVLISDIATLQANITQCLIDANDYTDTQILTRAPISHTHPSSQITDFNAAVQSVVSAMPSQTVSPGMIELWAGDPTVIGTGAMASWLKCDGASLLRSSYPALFTAIGTRFGSVDGTHFNLPNFQDRYAIGAGNTKAQGATNSLSAVLNTDLQGDHGHNLGATTLTLAHMPVHNHTVTVSGSGSGNTGAAGAHNHNNGGYNLLLTANGTGTVRDTDNTSGEPHLLAGGGILGVGDHAHSVSVSVSASGTTSSQGSGTGHTHPLDNAGAHTHQLTSQNLRDTIPYLALTYIIKT
jgi:microcystin-dependent protein